MLIVDNIYTYKNMAGILKGISIKINRQEIVALVGSNGAGKTTLLKSIMGIIPCGKGRIIFNCKDITAKPVHKIVNMGISLCPEGRQVFPRLTVLENLELGAYPCNSVRETKNSFERIYSLFPILKQRRHQLAGTLSGGEQQMLAIGRALMSRPVLLLLDEPSLGLAPVLVADIFSLIQDIRNQGVTILLVEQNANMALAMADRGYVLENGRIALEGTGSDLLSNNKVRQAYLG